MKNGIAASLKTDIAPIHVTSASRFGLGIEAAPSAGSVDTMTFRQWALIEQPTLASSTFHILLNGNDSVSKSAIGVAKDFFSP
jgi:hypothetical protein